MIPPLERVIQADFDLPSAAGLERLPVAPMFTLEVHGPRQLRTTMCRGEWFAASSWRASPVLGPRAFFDGAARWLLIGFDLQVVQRAMLELPERATARVVDVASRYASFAVDLAAPWSMPRRSPRIPTRYAVRPTAAGLAFVHCVTRSRYEVHVPLRQHPHGLFAGMLH